MTSSADPVLEFDGVDSYVEIPDSRDFSVPTTGKLAISAWMRPATLRFAHAEGSGYVHWLGKGAKGAYEWVFRMYSLGNTEDRANRISFYVFNPAGGLGIGSYFQDQIQVGEWIHVIGVADGQQTQIYKNGVLRRSDEYQGEIVPAHGSAPVRIATRDFASFFQGSIREVRVWNRVLTTAEVEALQAGRPAPKHGLVAEYLLAEGHGTLARDSTGRHNGEIYNTSWASD